jgi:lysozyme
MSKATQIGTSAATIAVVGAVLFAFFKRQSEGSTVPNPADPSAPFDPSGVYDPRDVTTRRMHAANFVPSEEVQAFIRRFESYRGTPYDLGDGGMTYGYGHQEPYNSPNIPDFISEPDARELFASDVYERGAVRVYDDVVRPVNQQEFDALVSVAFNLTLRSWRELAARVNAGDDVPSVLAQYVYATINGVKKKLRGLERRRAGEVAIWSSGDYSAG